MFMLMGCSSSLLSKSRSTSLDTPDVRASPGYLTQRERTSAVALAYWVPSEAIGAAIQLVLNLSAIVVAGNAHLARARDTGRAINVS
jgi:hypothetical protein